MRSQYACRLTRVMLCSFVFLARLGPAEEPKPPDEIQNLRKGKLLKWTREYSEKTRVTVLSDGQEQAATLKMEPVMRYSDEPRFISDATLWIWSVNSRPVAIQKVEINDTAAVPHWQVCFGSFAESNISVKWSGDRTFKSKTPGWVFEPIPNAEKPAQRANARTLQLRSLSRRFGGSVYSNTQKTNIEMRLLSKPTYEYIDPKSKLPVGAVFSLVSNGTNPTIFLAIEARRDKNGIEGWYHAHTRMTADTGALRLDDKTIWTFDDDKTDNWTYFPLPQETIPKE
ncbi:MAG: hypothetical protein JSS49_10785 [Planctomycetes bacterium]|nr:hypothetical protein [Planctomycetota bacterium]